MYTGWLLTKTLREENNVAIKNCHENACFGTSLVFKIHIKTLVGWPCSARARGTGTGCLLPAWALCLDTRCLGSTYPKHVLYSQNLALAVCQLVFSEGSDWPALFSARMRNWYWLPSSSLGTVPWQMLPWISAAWGVRKHVRRRTEKLRFGGWGNGNS